MKLYYDFHIHSALSPCGDDLMTPNNIVNMALLKELDAIAVTDHNASDNCRACVELGDEKGLIVVPGMEVQSKEEVHMLALFQTIEAIEAFQEALYRHYDKLPNRPSLFGSQRVLDRNDQIIREEPRLLIHSVRLGVKDLAELIHVHKGLAVPAHVDKKAFSLIANLGFIAPDLPVDAIEVSRHTNPEAFLAKNPQCRRYRILVNSDAHYLQDISEPENWLEVEEKSVRGIFEALGTVERKNP